MTSLIYILIEVLFFILIVPWVLFFAAPVIILSGVFALGTVVLQVALKGFYTVLNLNHHIKEQISKHFSQIPNAKMVCACVHEFGHKKIITAKFATNDAQWSYHASGDTMSAAFVRMQSKLLRHSKYVPDCGLRDCCNLRHCPKRQVKQQDTEIIRLHSTAS